VDELTEIVVNEYRRAREEEHAKSEEAERAASQESGGESASTGAPSQP
jgi:hypothetical protein